MASFLNLEMALSTENPRHQRSNCQQIRSQQYDDKNDNRDSANPEIVYLLRTFGGFYLTLGHQDKRQPYVCFWLSVSLP